jgi:hypothetical protein
MHVFMRMPVLMTFKFLHESIFSQMQVIHYVLGYLCHIEVSVITWLNGVAQTLGKFFFDLVLGILELILNPTGLQIKRNYLTYDMHQHETLSSASSAS